MALDKYRLRLLSYVLRKTFLQVLWGKFEIFTAKTIKFGVRLPYLLAVRD